MSFPSRGGRAWLVSQLSENKDLRKIDVSIFEKSGKNEFAYIIKKNKRKTTKALNDFFTGVKNEALDTKEATRIIAKFIGQQKISKTEEST